MILINLFLVFFRIGLLSLGGAYSFLPWIEKEVVQRYHWLTKEEFLDVLGITQLVPGAISIKYATYTGYKIGGVRGAVLANLGNILAPALLVILASVFYTRYKNYPTIKGALDTIRLCVFAMIIAVAFQVIDVHSLIKAKSLLIIILSFVIFIYTNLHPGVIIILAGIIGALWG
ncbi:MAG: chromate transporter [Candidatus Omnitrophica bacterium]|nr:chromate transporter [Candidatus Omnitrophota bacterium]